MIESDSVEWSRLRRAIRVSLVATPLVCALVAAIVYLLWYSAVDMHLMAKLTFGVVGVIIAALAGLASSAASNMLARVSRYPLEVAAWGAVVGATAVYLVFYHRQVEWSPVLAILGAAAVSAATILAAIKLGAGANGLGGRPRGGTPGFRLLQLRARPAVVAGIAALLAPVVLVIFAIPMSVLGTPLVQWMGYMRLSDWMDLALRIITVLVLVAGIGAISGTATRLLGYSGRPFVSAQLLLGVGIVLTHNWWITESVKEFLFRITGESDVYQFSSLESYLVAGGWLCLAAWAAMALPRRQRTPLPSLEVRR